jgi:hypothetical protein
VSPLGYVVGAVLVLIGGLAAHHWSSPEDMGVDDTGHVVFDRLDALCTERFGASYRFVTNQCCDRSDPGLCPSLRPSAGDSFLNRTF